MHTEEKALQAFDKWYRNRKVYIASGGPARGTICAALIVLERLKQDYNLNLKFHTAKGGTQIKGVSAAAASKILRSFGETRPFLKECGRTNRGARGDIEEMLEAIKISNLNEITAEERVKYLTEFQKYLIERIKEVHGRKRLGLIFDPSKTTWQIVHDLLITARESGKEGPVSQYLVGAKLQIRFPKKSIENKSYSTADEQLGRPGDFYVGDTAFHVTVSPMPPVYEKCKENINKGLRAYLLVPERFLEGSRQNAELVLPEKISVQSIESFISQNVEEISEFTSAGLISGLKSLLETYNKRVDSIETDKSLLIEIPRGLS